ncbi:MAG: prolyl oligopeptidase family serine peptidase [Gemmataceae bacterium]|nr:prolyl oligopeptidase family serine peptidase [Gemmataceae bacterium]
MLMLLILSAAPPVMPSVGDRMLLRYFRAQADALGKKPVEAPTKELRRRFMEMMGLDPLPARTALKAVVAGMVRTAHCRVERIHFQSMPGLYVTANLWLPMKAEGKLPTVLYLCGHAEVLVDGVSCGNKTAYQHHGAWLAENGYACLMVDTLQLGEARGLHHGTHRFGMWWWQALGYTPAGIELWNAMRAIDYLETRPEVDAKRLGVTGRSGGGAGSWWVMAADERVACGVPVAGLADLRAHLSEGYPGKYREGVVAGHCDCMYFVNAHRWDFGQVIALCAPRPVMLGNSDADAIFPVAGYRRPAESAKRLFPAGRFVLLETKGGHKDTPELREGAFRWLNRHLKGDEGKIEQPARERVRPQELKVFKEIPRDAINDIVHERFLRPARIGIPESAAVAREWWKGKAPRLKRELAEKVFAGWPAKPPALGAKLAGETVAHGLRLRAVDFLSEDEVPLRAWLLTAEKAKPVEEVVIEVCDETGWAKWSEDLGASFAPVGAGPGKKLRQLAATLSAYPLAFGIVAPRGVGPTRWSAALGEAHIRRRFALIGQTLDGQRVWDARRALAAFDAFADFKKAKRTLEGTGPMAGVALYAALFEPGVSKVEMRRPTTHRAGPTFLNVLRVLDLPQAAALAECEVRIEGDAKDWTWPLELQGKLGVKRIEVIPP